jgi:poly(A) polymerase
MQEVAKALAQLAENTQQPVVETLAAAFSKAGYELALVGGPVRDALLGKQTKDIDFTTNAHPDDILKVVKPLADATWDVGREFGTIAAEIKGERVEITTYRADSYDPKTRKPTVEFGDNLEDDLKRRDFTINSMALRLPERVFVDPHEGLRDLQLNTLRTPSAAEISFSDDPLRMLRAARFSSQLNLSIEPAAFDAMVELKDRIRIISAERIRDELTKLLLTDNPTIGLELLVDSGLASIILPELTALKLETDEHMRHKDVYQHTLTVLMQAIDYEKNYQLEKDIVVRLAALLHDIGKPATRKLDGKLVTFYHHDVVGAKLAKKRLTELRFSNDQVDSVAKLIELHLRFFGYSDSQWTDSAVRRYVRDAGEELDRLHILTRSDVTTRNQKKAERLAHAYDDLEQRIAQLREQEELDSIRPELDGNQIMEILGIGPSREVGLAYDYLLEVRLDEGEIGPEAAKNRLLSWWQAR